MKQWGDMSQVFIGNGRARLPESLDDSGDLERVPYQDGVRYQAQAARLVHELLVIPSAKFTLVGEKDPACQTVPGPASTPRRHGVSCELRVRSNRWVAGAWRRATISLPLLDWP
jgi:hypothetical protein